MTDFACHSRGNQTQFPGKVYLVGAGPGDPDLLTRKAERILREADVVLHDDLVSSEILALIPAGAQVRNVGKRHGTKVVCQQAINTLMVEFAYAGLTVVRLKGGDPMIFGRAEEEIAALRSAEIEFEVVPGVTAALAAAAAAQVPLTQRYLSSAVILTTYSRAANQPRPDWRGLIASGGTIVLYMPGKDYDDISRTLIDSGLTEKTPCVIVSRATTSQEVQLSTTLDQLPRISPLQAPALLIVGPTGPAAEISIIEQDVPSYGVPACPNGSIKMQ